MKLIRVRYGKKDTPVEDREYQIDGVGPVGNLKEFKERFPDEELEVKEREVNNNWDKYLELMEPEWQEKFCN